MIKTLAVCCCAVLVTGCALPTLDHGAIGALQGKSIVRASQPTAGLTMTTPGNAAVAGFGLLGAAAATAGGAKQGGGAPFEVPDPSLAISAKIAEQLSQRYGTKTSATVIYQPMNGSEMKARAGPLADYTLHVFTYNMNMAFYLTGPSRYRILFTTMANLIDNKTQQTIATSVCVNQPDETASSATYDQMLANNGERAKRELAEGVDMCAQKLLQNMMSK